jgi:hypothetical protein
MSAIWLPFVGIDPRIAAPISANDNEGVLPIAHHHAGCHLRDRWEWCDACIFGFDVDRPVDVHRLPQ